LAYEDMHPSRQRRHPRQYEHATPRVSPDRSYHRRRRYNPIVEFHNDRRASHAQLPEDSARESASRESGSSASEWLVRSRVSRRRRQATPHPSRRARRPRRGQIDGYLSETPTRDATLLRSSSVPTRTRNSVPEATRSHQNEQCSPDHRPQPKSRGARAGPASHQCLGCFNSEDGHACQPSSSRNPFGGRMPLGADGWEELGEPGGNDGGCDGAVGL
jgi:hypothetical protein